MALPAWIFAATVAWSNFAAAEVQVGSTVNSEGPGPAVGPRNVVGSADNPPNGTVTGAIQSIAADPSNASTLYVGAVDGGIWKTTDGGATWIPLSDQKASLSIASLSLDPTDGTHRTLVAGTGSTSNGGFTSISTFSTPGNFGGVQNGLLYSTDGGASFTTLGAATFSGQSVVDVAARGNTILAATFEPRVATAGGTVFTGGLYRSTDGGATFVQGAAGLPPGPITSLVGDPSNPNTFYAAVTASGAGNLAQTGIYRSTDGGATWIAVFTAANSAGTISAGAQTTIKLTVGPGGTIAAGVVNTASSNLVGLFYSNTGGNPAPSWTHLTTPAVTNGQAPINLALAIDPTSTNIVYVSGDNNFNTNGGINALAIVRVNATTNTATRMSDDTSAPVNTSNGSTTHPDSRVLMFDANGRLLIGTDGGIYARTSPLNNTGQWTGMNNLATMELYSLAYDANSKRLVISAQDNGSSLQAAPGSKTFNQLNGGDGINARVNDTTLGTQSAIYTTCQFLACAERKIVDSQGNTLGQANIQFNVGVAGNFFTSQFILNNIDPTRIAVAGTSIYTTQDTLTGANGVGTGTVNLALTNLGATGRYITALDYGTRNNVNALVAGGGLFDNPAGSLFISTTGSAGSIVTLAAYAGMAATSVKFDTRSDSRFFVADSQNLYGTVNQGTTFQTLTVNLPANFIRPTSLGFIDSNGVAALLVGGLNNADNAGNPLVVADSDAAGALSGWRRFASGLPNTTVDSLQYNAKSDTLAIGTVGRGAYLLYDVTSNFASASVLQFGLANNDSIPDPALLFGNRPLVKYGTGILSIVGASTYTGSTTVLQGAMAAAAAGVFASSSAFTVAGGAFLNLNSFNQTIGSLAGAGTVSLGTATLTSGTDNSSTLFSGVIDGIGGALIKTGAGTFTLSGTNTYTGSTTVSQGMMAAGAAGVFAPSSAFTVAGGAVLNLNSFNQTVGSLAGAGTVSLGTAALTSGTDNSSTLFSGVIDGIGGSLIKTGAGTFTLSGNNSYTGTTTVNGGVLQVDGSIAASSLLQVNASAALAGVGTVGNTTISANGVFAPGSGTPGSSMTIQGSLAMQSGALYLVMLNPTTASFATVTGAANLGGATVDAVYANGSYISKRYTIMTAGSVNGMFSSLVNSNVPANFSASLSYDPTHAYLDLTLGFAPSTPNFGPGLNTNQKNVGDALINFFNSTGGIPTVFGMLTPAGLTQVSGELGTGSQQTTFQAMTQFMGVLLDPFIDGRGASAPAGGAAAYSDSDALAYASGGKKRSANERDAYAALYRKAPLQQIYDPRWSVWTAAYGGSQNTAGNAALGSNDTASRIFGTAVGFDYRFSPNTIAGFALAGGGTNFNVANGLGSGRSDLFQAGAFIRHNAGATYVSGALAYGWQDVTTNRTVTVAGIDQLRAQFNANAWSGRVEGGYRFVSPWMRGIGITPYAAAQFTTFELPAYAEGAVVGANTFALAYASKSVTASRSELGLRSDKSFALQDGIFTLRGRAAWAHDFNPDRNIGATFQTLPGASFVVNGAAQAHDAALVTGSAEKKWLNGWSASATFEGEFSNVTTSYAGKGVARYSW
jgi:autotransporter-associated beta strand protein